MLTKLKRLCYNLALVQIKVHIRLAKIVQNAKYLLDPALWIWEFAASLCSVALKSYWIVLNLKTSARKLNQSSQRTREQSLT